MEAKAHLGDLADKVTWIEGDITQTSLPVQAYDLE
jgi:hypothetical protein